MHTKFGIVTNELGIIRHIAFYDKNFFEAHPDIKIEKKSNSPDEINQSTMQGCLSRPWLISLKSIRLLIPKPF